MVAITADINALFETLVGVIHRIDERTHLVVHTDPGQPGVADADITSLVVENRHATVDRKDDGIREPFTAVTE